MRFTPKGCKIIAFFLIFLCLFSAVSRVVTVNPSEPKLEAYATDLLEEAPNSLDAVYIGSSNCIQYWNPMIAYEHYGIAVHSYSWPYQPLFATEHLIREARKTQPDALYIVNVNTVFDVTASPLMMLHNTLDFMPFSLNKLSLMDKLCDLAELSFSERLEYFFPLIRYHSRWSELAPVSFQGKPETMKVSPSGWLHLHKSEDLSDSYVITEETAPLEEDLVVCLEELMAYCEEEQVKILFVIVPQAKVKETNMKFNAVKELLEGRGFPVVDLQNHPEAIAFDPSLDLYDLGHTNIHGSLKFTHYLSQYLVDNYGFSSRREDAVLASWEEEVAPYRAVIAPYALDFEISGAPRNISLPAPILMAEAGEKGTSLRWEAIDGAEGYALYRKDTAAAPWQRIGDTEETAFLDEEKNGCVYTVVPYLLRDGQAVYGSFDYYGIQAG